MRQTTDRKNILEKSVSYILIPHPGSTEVVGTKSLTSSDVMIFRRDSTPVRNFIRSMA